MFYAIRHFTRYRYSRSVWQSMMEVRMHPRSEGNQRCFVFQLSVNPSARIFGYTDSYGNLVHHFDLPSRHGQLTIISDAVGIAGGALVSVALLGLNPTSYFHTSYRALHYADVVQGLTKPLFSGFIIATIGCYYGLNTKGGTQGVGRATTQAVVASSVFIIVVDFIVSRAMLFAFGQG